MHIQEWYCRRRLQQHPSNNMLRKKPFFGKLAIHHFGVFAYSNWPQCSLLDACNLICTMLSYQHLGLLLSAPTPTMLLRCSLMAVVEGACCNRMVCMYHTKKVVKCCNTLWSQRTVRKLPQLSSTFGPSNYTVGARGEPPNRCKYRFESTV